MPRTRTFTTGVDLSLWDGGEQRLVLFVDYVFRAGYPGTQVEPPEPSTAEITAVCVTRDGKPYSFPAWMEHLIESDEALLDSLVRHACESDQADREDAAERRAEADRDDRLVRAR